MFNPYALIVAIVVGLGLFGSGVSIGRKWEEGQQAAAEAQTRAAVDAAINASAEAIAKIKVTNKTIQNEVRHEIERETVYRDCKLTPDGVRLANQALDGAKPAGEGKLPKADPAGK